jgi:hypothetical protein
MSLVLASGVLSASAHATTKQEYQSATVVSVESHETPSNYAGFAGRYKNGYEKIPTSRILGVG